MARLFFILGRGRSGTSLLARMLGRHSEIAVAPEGFFAMNLLRKYRSGPWNHKRVEAFCRDLVREERMRGWDLDLERLMARLQERAGSLTYADACLTVYLSYAEDTLGRRTPQWVGDKNPHYALLIERVARAFPHARYVHITRDYRDNILSFTEAPFDLRNPAALAQRWKQYNQEILKVSRKTPERCLWLRYEDLVVHPEHELTRVCRFLGVPFEPGMLSFHEPDQPPAHARRAPPYQGARRPLDPLQSQRWRKRLPEPVVRRADAICGEFAERFGYHPTTLGERPLSFPTLLGALYGRTSVLAEKLLFGALPTTLRIELINGYRRLLRAR